MHLSDEHTNSETYPAWVVATGVDYPGLFADRAPGFRKWPKFVDPRLARKGRPTIAAPLCAKFQMTGKCVKNSMTVPEFNQVDRIIREVLAQPGGTGSGP